MHVRLCVHAFALMHVRLIFLMSFKGDLKGEFLAPTGAQGEAMSCVRVCVRDIPQKNIENEF